MDFERVLRDLASDFNEREVPYELLAERYSSEIDWKRIREYFALFGRLELYDEIRAAHGPADRG